MPSISPESSCHPMKSIKLRRHVAISLLAAGPVGGFLFGLIRGGDPDPNPVGRIIYGCMMAVVTPLHAGFPPHYEAGPGRSANAWPYIAAAGALVLIGLVVRDWRSSRRQSEPSAAAGIL